MGGSPKSSMATTIIPIVAAALGAAGPIIGKIAIPLVQVAESIFGPGTGKSKAATVLAALKSFLGSLATSGTLPQAVPSDEELASVIEGVLATLKASGQLPTAGSGVAISTPVTGSATIASMISARSVLTALIGD